MGLMTEFIKRLVYKVKLEINWKRRTSDVPKTFAIEKECRHKGEETYGGFLDKR